VSVSFRDGSNGDTSFLKERAIKADLPLGHRMVPIQEN
jgi:hypothetical protein